MAEQILEVAAIKVIIVMKVMTVAMNAVEGLVMVMVVTVLGQT